MSDPRHVHLTGMAKSHVVKLLVDRGRACDEHQRRPQDGLIDVYVVDSLTVDTAKDPRVGRSELYRNLVHGKF